MKHLAEFKTRFEGSNLDDFVDVLLEGEDAVTRALGEERYKSYHIASADILRYRALAHKAQSERDDRGYADNMSLAQGLLDSLKRRIRGTSASGAPNGPDPAGPDASPRRSHPGIERIVGSVFMLGRLFQGYVSMLMIYKSAKEDRQYADSVAGILIQIQSICADLRIRSPCRFPANETEAEGMLRNFFSAAGEFIEQIREVYGHKLGLAFMFASSSEAGKRLGEMVDEGMRDAQFESLVQLGAEIGLSKERIAAYMESGDSQADPLAKTIAEYLISTDSIRVSEAPCMTRNTGGRRVFIGHGHSVVWRDLKDFLQDRLNLPWDEFNREPAAGKTTQQRLGEMLDNAAFAFLVMTAEEQHGRGRLHARENVVHEIGLFQGRLGFPKAIVLLEEGCQEFSNIHGLVQIRFAKGNIAAVSEEIRRVLEREGVVSSGAEP